jgi:hypothetical protein
MADDVERNGPRRNVTLNAARAVVFQNVFGDGVVTRDVWSGLHRSLVVRWRPRPRVSAFDTDIQGNRLGLANGVVADSPHEPRTSPEQSRLRILGILRKPKVLDPLVGTVLDNEALNNDVSQSTLMRRKHARAHRDFDLRRQV